MRIPSMNDPTVPPASPSPASVAAPVSPPHNSRPRSTGMGCLLPLVLVVLFLSLFGNLLLGLVLVSDFADKFESESSSLNEKFLLGDRDADAKIAVIRIDGVIAEYTMDYPIKQMAAAAKDEDVKAVVLRIDSPGGTVTASEELYQCAVNLRDDNDRRFAGTGKKPVSVSMGGVAASGGYYIAMAGKPVAAERTTITGSIGVFVALPNIAELAHNNGVHVELVKAGDIKGSGSFFHAMTPEERQTWQDTVDHAYDTFLGVVSSGRSLPKEKLRDEVVIDRTIPVRNEKGNPVSVLGAPMTAKYTRKRADGGTYTADQALQFGLIDSVDDLPATIRKAAASAGITKFKAVVYHKPPSVFDLLMGDQVRTRQGLPEFPALQSALTPRLWFMMPTADGAILTPR
jgi:protease-4